MNLKNYYYYFQSSLSPRICDAIVDYGKAHQPERAITGGFNLDRNKEAYKNDGTLKKGALKNLQKKRKSDIVWMSDQWIYKEIHPFIHEANEKSGWNFDWDFSESCQFTKYDVGQHYGWHCDSWDKPYDRPDDPNTHGKIRKLSVTVSLSDPSEYEGGNLEFFGHDFDEKSRERGTLILFPSYTWHRVTKLTKGDRKALVGWVHGPSFQ